MSKRTKHHKTEIKYTLLTLERSVTRPGMKLQYGLCKSTNLVDNSDFIIKHVRKRLWTKETFILLNLHLNIALILKPSYINFYEHNSIQTYGKYNSCTLKIFNPTFPINRLTLNPKKKYNYAHKISQFSAVFLCHSLMGFSHSFPR